MDDEHARVQLEAFRGKNLKRWGWFVQNVHRISENDFKRLTRIDDLSIEERTGERK